VDGHGLASVPVIAVIKLVLEIDREGAVDGVAADDRSAESSRTGKYRWTTRPWDDIFPSGKI